MPAALAKRHKNSMMLACRWAAGGGGDGAGEAARAQSPPTSDEDSEDEGPTPDAAAAAARVARTAAEIKRCLTSILLDVTDAMFGGVKLCHQ